MVVVHSIVVSSNDCHCIWGDDQIALIEHFVKMKKNWQPNKRTVMPLNVGNLLALVLGICNKILFEKKCGSKEW